MAKPPENTAIIAALVLAAGFSRRFGAADKLVADFADGPDGSKSETVLSRSLAAYHAAPLHYRLAVVQPNSPLSRICAAAGFDPVENPQAADGMGTSIACGLAALMHLDTPPSHVLIGLADMPQVQPHTVATLCAAAGTASIVLPCHDGQAGHPRLFAERHFADLRQLTGDTGGKSIIAACHDVNRLAVDDAAVLLDIDTPQHLADAQS